MISKESIKEFKQTDIAIKKALKLAKSKKS